MNRSKLRGDHWASFVVTPGGETLLAGFYGCRYLGVNEVERIWPHTVGTDPAGTCDVYELTLDERLNDLASRLVIAWGAAAKYAYRAVVCTCVCPSNLPIIGNP